MTPATKPTEFQNFQTLARRILTTPKAELMKNVAKIEPSKPGKKKAGAK